MAKFEVGDVFIFLIPQKSLNQGKMKQQQASKGSCLDNSSSGILPWVSDQISRKIQSTYQSNTTQLGRDTFIG